MNDTPNFAAWQTDALTQYALEQYLENIKLHEANEQLRMDNRDLSKINRQLLTKEKP